MFHELKVVELASVLAGPSVGQFFAELGAEVIKVENVHTGGDVTRTWKVKNEDTDDRSSYFCSVNWGKKSIAIDLNRTEGKTIVYKLVEKSDIVIASYKSGDAEKLGVDYKTLSSLNPHLIYGQISGFGSSNPRVGYDAVIQAEGGFMFLNGEPDGPSLKMPVALMDILAAHHLKEGILLALLRKNRTGKGDFLEVSLLQAAVSSLANQAANWLVAGVTPQKQGSTHPNIAPYGDIFRTLEGHEILLAIGSDRQFTSLCKILNLADVNERYRTNVLRVKNRPALNQLLGETIAFLPLNTLVSELQAANIPYGIIKDMQEVFETPEVQGLLLQSDDRIGVRTYVGTPFRDGASHFLPPPHLGEHSQEILIQSLAMPAQEIKSLVKAGIII
ncbi:MAG TPA: CaiB/BaiF CoA-transferase family protein [Chryseolinea sp.]|nr:CaiB/BaiF CoA-transferase family protein [Chryseolinea sp.]